MESGLRAVKVAAIVMGVLIVLGVSVILVTIAKRITTGAAVPAGKPFAAMLDEPTGTQIAEIAAVRDLLAVRLHGGGPDRVLIIDPVSGTVTGRISTAR